MKITLEDYLQGRDTLYPPEYTSEIRLNSRNTVDAVNELLYRLEASKVTLEKNPTTGSIVSSGWRPPQINSAIKNAAVRSNHMTGKACDLYDPDGVIDAWLYTFLPANPKLGLYMEHPACTKGWAHVQTVPPRSGKVVFYP